jgi:hypothetical protein
MKLSKLEAAVDHKLKRLASPGSAVLEEGRYKGYIYTVYTQEGKIYWMAAHEMGTAHAKSEAIHKAKMCIEKFVAANGEDAE